VIVINLVADNSIISPNSTILKFGADVSFQCSRGKNIMWFYESHKFNPSSPPISKKSIYQKNHIKSTDSGNYFCFGYYKDNDKTFFSKTSIRVFGKVPH